MHFSAPAALLGLFLSTAVALDLTLYLPPKPNPFTLPPSTHATLSALHEHRTAPISSVNTFVFRNVTAPGSYLVDVHSATDAFRPLRVDVSAEGKVEAWETYRGNDWSNQGEAVVVREGSAGLGFELRALGGKNYFQERPKFSILTILKNPMILMGLVSMVMFVGMPKLMENMDPEMKAELEARRSEGGPLASLMGGGGGGSTDSNFDMAAYLAGSNKDGASATGSSSGNGGSSKNSKGVKRK